MHNNKAGKVFVVMLMYNFESDKTCLFVSVIFFACCATH